MVYSPVHSNESAPSGVHIYGRSVHTNPEKGNAEIVKSNNGVVNTKTSVECIAQQDLTAVQRNLFLQ